MNENVKVNTLKTTSEKNYCYRQQENEIKKKSPRINNVKLRRSLRYTHTHCQHDRSHPHGHQLFLLYNQRKNGFTAWSHTIPRCLAKTPSPIDRNHKPEVHTRCELLRKHGTKARIQYLPCPEVCLHYCTANAIMPTPPSHAIDRKIFQHLLKDVIHIPGCEHTQVTKETTLQGGTCT